MKRNMTMRVAACAVAFVAISAFGVELTHRWSFNGDYSDSTGGADAVKCGTYVSLYGGRVHMGYGSWNGWGQAPRNARFTGLSAISTL